MIKEKVLDLLADEGVWVTVDTHLCRVSGFMYHHTDGWAVQRTDGSCYYVLCCTEQDKTVLEHLEINFKVDSITIQVITHVQGGIIL